MNGSSKVYRETSVWQATTLTEESKNRSAQWAHLHAIFPALMKKLNNGKSTHLVFLLTHGQWKTGLFKGCLTKRSPMEITLGIYGEC